MGFIDFTAGDKPTAAQFDEMFRQTTMVFATDAARNTALSAVLDDGQTTYMEDAPKRYASYDGTAWRIIGSAWTTWTPTYANLTVGDGTVSARYHYSGYREVTCKWTFTLGSTSSVGTGPTLTVPVAPVDANELYQARASYNDSGSIYEGAVTPTGGSTVALVVFNTAGTYAARAGLTATVPFTFATGDVLRFSATYEV